MCNGRKAVKMCTNKLLSVSTDDLPVIFQAGGCFIYTSAAWNTFSQFSHNFTIVVQATSVGYFILYYFLKL